MNAIYELVTRDSHGPSAKLVYRVCIGLGLLVTAYLSWETLYRWPLLPTLGAQLFRWASLLLCILPPVVAFIAGLVTARHARRIDFALLKTTPLSQLEIAWGFFRGALYRCRFILAPALCLIPISAIGALQWQAELEYSHYATCKGDCFWYFPIYGDEPTIDTPTYTDSTKATGISGAAYWASTFASVSIGVYYGIKNRNSIFAAAVSTAVTLLCLFVPGACVIMMVGPFPEFLYFTFVPTVTLVGCISFAGARELAASKLLNVSG